ncbi:hypothetical protein [Thermicanus aegyptius]|uniref:hypothetical protein n=1 Tax=Thermicanus aegyptius TaxID=94009 RepID=UPI00048B7CFC|nr:hypothetical protein [Thermicanus aegyptius]
MIWGRALKKIEGIILGLGLLFFIWGLDFFRGEALADDGMRIPSQNRDMSRTFLLMAIKKELNADEVHTLWEGVEEYPSLPMHELRNEWLKVLSLFPGGALEGVPLSWKEVIYPIPMRYGVKGLVRFHLLPAERDEYAAALIVKLEANEPMDGNAWKSVQEKRNTLGNLGRRPYIYTCIKGVGDGTPSTLLSKPLPLVEERMPGTWGEYCQDRRSWSARFSGKESLQVLFHERGENRTEVILGTPYIITEF